MRYATVCSGIEAPSLAWGPLGWEAVWFSEVDPFCCELLKQRFPDVPNLGDMTADDFCDRANEHGPIDLICGGTPCQSFSVAGLRAGMADPRGNLALVFLAIVDRLRPVWLVWENVPGVHSSWSDEATAAASEESREVIEAARQAGIDAGLDIGTAFSARDFEEADQTNDFDCFLSGLEELGYGVATRVLDAQHAGVPQRRRRVFVVGHSGDWRRAAAVLFERHSLSGDLAPCRETGAGVARCVATGTNGQRYDGETENFVAATLNSGGNNGGFRTEPGEHLVTHSLRADGFDASEDGTGRGTPLVAATLFASEGGASSGYHPVVPVAFDWQSGGDSRGLDPKHTAQMQRRQVPAVAFAQNQRHELRTMDTAGGLAAEPGMNQQTFVIGATNGSTPEADAVETLRTLRSEVGEEAFTEWRSRILDSLQSPKVLQLAVHGCGIRRAASEAGAWLDDGSLPRAEDLPAGAMRQMWQDGPDGRSSQGRELAQQLAREFGAPLPFMSHQTAPVSRVRRLTPKETERLQGMPDNWTAITYRGKPAADGPRYRAIGNSMAVPVVRWIGERIKQVEQNA